MNPLIFYFQQFWQFCLGENLNFKELWNQGDAVGLLAMICTCIMVFGFFLKPVYRICTFQSVRGKNRRIFK